MTKKLSLPTHHGNFCYWSEPTLHSGLFVKNKMADPSVRTRAKRKKEIIERKKAPKGLHGKGVGEMESPYFSVEEKTTSKDLSFKRKRKKMESFDGDSAASCRDLKLARIFYDAPAVDLAKQLLGKILHRVLDSGDVLSGRIVETEAYLGVTDKACHAFDGKRTARTEPMFMSPGTAYVYIIYGMYHCLNISSKEPGACVLIRALEPITGQYGQYSLLHLSHTIKNLQC